MEELYKQKKEMLLARINNKIIANELRSIIEQAKHKAFISQKEKNNNPQDKSGAMEIAKDQFPADEEFKLNGFDSNCE